ncbi:MAG: heme lyase CcmF/NrfE family subunit [Nitrospirae bacterium]|nr:MAG: heme lyase CcmF/NrfE family subunit [Nitrospirota bacterium]
MADLGNFALILAFTFASYALVATLWGARSGREALVRSGERAALVVAACMVSVMICLDTLLVRSDFHVEYVASYTNRDLPLFFKVAALWAGQAGSLLLWSTLISIFTAIVVLQNRRRNRELIPYVVAILSATSLFFIVLNLFVTNPFDELVAHFADGTVAPYVAPDGKGLNPLLQHPAMVMHPPTLFVGYTGFVVPYAFAMAALITGELGNKWIGLTRRWTIVPWFFLGTGILLGGNWAYQELGWGGYWAWDPVENASFMPWLTGTAFLHSVMIQEKKGMLKVWNMVLIILTFSLSILGTFLTRSGVVSSVHAFAKSSIGGWFLGFLVVMVAFSLVLLFLRLPQLKAQHQIESMVSREASFLFNNLLLLGAAFSILWGTLFPILSEAVQGVKITVGPPFFNRVNVPLGLALLLLTGVGPVLAWRKTSGKGLRRNFTLPLLAAAATAAGVVFLGHVHHPYAVISFALAAFVTATIVMEFARGTAARARNTGESWPVALARLTLKNKRRYGGYIVHFGIVVLFVGLTGKAFTQEGQFELAPGETAQVGHYTLRMVRMEERETPNYRAVRAYLAIAKDGKDLGYLAPERRIYTASQQPTSEVSIHSTLAEDLYTVFASPTPDGQKGIIQVWVNPLVNLVWGGGVLVALGTFVAMLPDRAQRRRLERMLAATAQEAGRA